MNYSLSREDLIKLMGLPPKMLRDEIISELKYGPFDDDESYLGSRYTIAKLAYRVGLLDEMKDFISSFIENVPECMEKALLYLLMGRAYQLEENLVMANSYYVKVLYITEEEKYSSLNAKIYLYLSFICIKIDEFDRALYYLSRIDLTQPETRQRYRIDVAIHEAYANGRKGDTLLFVDQLNKIYKAYQNDMDSAQTALLFEFAGDLLYMEGNDRVALEKYTKSISYSSKFKNIDGRFRYGITCHKLARIQYNLKIYREACVNAEAAYGVFINHSNKLYLEKTGILVIRCFFALKRYDEAYDFFIEESGKGFTTREVVNRNMSKIVDTFKDIILLRKDLAETIKKLDEYKTQTVKMDNEVVRLKGGTYKFKLLNDFLFELVGIEDEDELYELAYKYISQLMVFKIFYIACLDVNEFNINFDSRNAILGTHEKHTLLYNPTSIVSQIIRKRKTVLINSIADATTGSSGINFNNQEIENNSHIFVPMMNEDRAFGVVSVQTEEKNYYSDIDVELFETFAEILASAITLIRKNKEIEKKKLVSTGLTEELKKKNSRLLMMGQFDDLTGLFNRHGLEEAVNQIMLSSSLPIDVSVMMLDIDKFKQFNDNYGHLMGDEYLKEVSELIRETFRPEEAIVARYGGEEFLVVVPFIKNVSVLEQAERMRIKIVEYGQELNLCMSTSISIGLCSGTMKDREDLNALIKLSDSLLYRAKNTGRNKICSEWDFDKR